jgi:cholesterol transport system auxiliary component
MQQSLLPANRAVVRWWLSPALLSLVLAGCAGSLLQPAAETPTGTYLLAWQSDGSTPVTDPAGPDLLVSSVLASPGFDSSDMAYVRTPHQIEYFARHRWVDAPARMLEPLLSQAAAQTGLFRSVAEPGGGTRADLRLDSKLLHLQQACRLNPSELQLALRVSLVDVANARIVGSRTLSISEPIYERTPYAGVEAANRAVARLLSQLQDFLAEQVRWARQ